MSELRAITRRLVLVRGGNAFAKPEVAKKAKQESTLLLGLGPWKPYVLNSQCSKPKKLMCVRARLSQSSAIQQRLEGLKYHGTTEDVFHFLYICLFVSEDSVPPGVCANYRDSSSEKIQNSVFFLVMFYSNLFVSKICRKIVSEQ